MGYWCVTAPQFVSVTPAAEDKPEHFAAPQPCTGSPEKPGKVYYTEMSSHCFPPRARRLHNYSDLKIALHWHLDLASIGAVVCCFRQGRGAVGIQQGKDQ